MAYAYNPDFQPRVGGVFEPKPNDFDLTNQSIETTFSKRFEASFPDVFAKYKLPRTTEKERYDDWLSNQMQFGKIN